MEGSANWLRAGLMSIGLAAVLVAVSEAPVWHWSSTRTLGLLVAGLIVLAAWAWSETRAREPLVDMRMMRIRGVWTTNAVAALLGFGMYSSFILLPDYVETPKRVGYGFGASVTGAGLFLVPATVAMLVFGAQTGRLERRFGSKPPLLAGALAAGGAYTVGGAFGGAAVASILAGSVAANGYPSGDGFTAAFVACAIAPALGVLIGFLIPGRRPQDAVTGREVGELRPET